jgi:uncharacterized protein YegJ (DUF2314 family)
MQHGPWIGVWLAAVSALAIAVSAGGCSKKGGQSSKDGFAIVEDNDPDMAAAIAKARASLPRFWQRFEHPGPGESAFCLKVKITDEKGTEHFWVNKIERSGDRIFGVINNEPDIVKVVKLGQRIQIPEADISDWLYMRNGKMVGNYTLRALFKTMTPEEVARHKKRLADP